MKDLADQVILITGASRGIGAATAKLAAEQGAIVVINHLDDADNAQDLVREIEAGGGRATALEADVSQPEQVKLLFTAIKKELGGVDVLVNNAGIMRTGMLTMTRLADLDDQLAVNVRGTFLCMQRAAKQMMRKKSGRVISIASIVGLVGARGYSAYAASKAAVIGMSLAAAKELGPFGITVNVVAPGVIETDLIAGFSDEDRARLVADNPSGRLGTVDDVARAILSLASPGADYINGQVLSVDGGQVM